VRRTWQVRTRTHGLTTVIRRSDLRDGEDAIIVAVREADVATWLADPLASRSAVDMHKAVRASHVASASLGKPQLTRRFVRDLTDAFRRNELVALRRRDRVSLPVISAAETAPPEPPPEQVVEKKVKTWIEIVLQTKEGDPVPGMPYRLKLPDGTVQEGRLDSRGRARADGIDPGTCEVTFHELDGREWAPA
jgi:hypothetical protein